MKNEQKFISECMQAFLGNFDYEKIKRFYEAANRQNLNKLISNYNIEGFFYHLYLNKIFNKISIPADTIELWKKVSGRNSLVNAINDREAFNIINLLDINKVDYIYIKGLSTRTRCYGSYYLKSSTDIDLFIKKTDYKKVKDILLADGYEIPHNHYVEDFAVKIPFEEYEKRAHEISFVKKQNALRFIVDLQWDFIISESTSVFYKLYNIGSFYKFDSSDEIELEGHKLKVLSLESEFVNMSFHFAFNHGFRGVQWLIDLCQFVKINETKIDFDLINKSADSNLKKILGIILMIAYEFNSKPKMDRKQRKMFFTDRFLPFEYSFYKSMLFKSSSNNSVVSKVGLRMIRILLPYRMIDRLRVIEYLFFNIDSIRQRLGSGKKIKSFLLPYYLLKLFISDIIKKNEG